MMTILMEFLTVSASFRNQKKFLSYYGHTFFDFFFRYYDDCCCWYYDDCCCWYY